MKARITGVATCLPEQTLSSADVERRIEGYAPHGGVIERLTGIRTRHVARDGEQASDLAVGAARGLDHADVDLLIFASASQDMVEPATAHIVAAKLGLSCPVFDVKNACNSMLNGIQVAEALILSGAHRKVLVCSGEVPSRAVRWQVRDRAQFVDSFAGYTLSDSGAAVLVEADPARGIFYRDFAADSTAWAVGTLPGGGSAHPRDPEYSYFRGDGRRLKEAFELAGPDIFLNALKRTGLTWDDFAIVAVHQVALPYLRFLARVLEIPEDKLVVSLPEHGNCASTSLPLQLALGGWRPGDRVALLGLGGGISTGVMLAEM
ncbi:3-oxoacyl-[acyl-carrier-protein] synthase-3 [Streptosporangium becharense]|uniref:3-oxoacyl-[acyl-carrier-protein] synthase-3 n=1 Tax=Streptosporangium becharense TaxID=1816182 RepID=A0A7W9MH40_9ACTN|nr:ketoacyl-ACP synthase III [Streptosporangium becharense]MBB2912631.1 3-oxoacyl-[acyl-carrier-protein] synthase-3 [Streptosporangium becharense]MBB5820540.1 3-oxoacyl-[acyl-carrier-protein] synthase-3 [Streptosporangium becharense]